MRRRVAAVLGALAIAAITAGPVAGPVAAQDAEPPLPTPRLRIQPGCIAPLPPSLSAPQGSAATASLRIRGSGLDARQRIVLRFVTSTGQSAPLPDVTTDQLGTFDTTVTIDRPSSAGSHRVVARHPDTEAQLAVGIVSSPCRPAIAVATECFGDRGANRQRFRSLVVRGSDWLLPGDTVTVSASKQGESSTTPLGTARVRDDGTFRLEVERPQRLGLGTFRIGAQSGELKDARALALVVAPCPEPGLRLVPDCAPAGPRENRWSIRVVGTGFRPKAIVLVIFDRPRSHEVFPVSVPDDGRFVIRIRPRRRPPGEYDVRAAQMGAFQLASIQTNALAAVAQAPLVDARLARATFTVPCPVFEEAGAISVRPRCGPPRLDGDQPRDIDHRVIGSGFREGPVTVRFDVGAQAEEVHEAVADADGEFVARFTTRRRARSPIAIRAEQGGSVTGSAATFSVTAETVYESPCNDRSPPPLVVAPGCGLPVADREDAYAIEVAGEGFFGSSLVFLAFEGSDAEFAVAADGDGAFSRPLEIDDLGVGEHVVRAMQRRATRQRQPLAVATGSFIVPCPLEPEIEISPEYGPSGQAAHIEGRGFPPGTEVAMTWDRGIEAGRDFLVTVGPEGTFSTYVFILPNDFTGERQLSAVVQGHRELYPEATHRYVVAPGSGIPPGPDGDIVDRR